MKRTGKGIPASPRKRQKLSWTDEKVKQFLETYVQHITAGGPSDDWGELEAKTKTELGLTKSDLERKFKELEEAWVLCAAHEEKAELRRESSETWHDYFDRVSVPNIISKRAKSADFYDAFADQFASLRSASSPTLTVTDAKSRFAGIKHIRHSSNVFKIALSGGPCAGKTSVLSDLRDYIQELGLRCFIVPEAATMFLAGGVDVEKDLSSEEFVDNFQISLLATQLHLEDSFCALAATLCPSSLSIVICDRGCMDGKAYMTQKMWDEMLGLLHLTEEQLRDERYDAVCFLDTAVHAYQHLGNARAETAAEANTLNEKTLACWRGHRNVCEFSSTRKFSQKRNRVRAWVEHQLRPLMSDTAN